jgi:uncharacterized membrane protein
VAQSHPLPSDGVRQQQLAPARLRPSGPLLIRKIGFGDLRGALAEGIDDFWVNPSHLVFLGIIYPLLGLFLARLVSGYEVLPLLFPLAAGFALIGPFAAVGLYELSRRRELNLDSSWSHVFDVFHLPSRGAILTLGALLLVIFFGWLASAMAIYNWTFEGFQPASMADFIREIFSTKRGANLLIFGIGTGTGFLYTVVVLSISVISFPLLLDRNVDAGTAILASLKTVRKNPVMMALWGLIVAAALIIGSIPFFIGLAVVMPILGHATWHLYRRVVVD